MDITTTPRLPAPKAEVRKRHKPMCQSDRDSSRNTLIKGRHKKSISQKLRVILPGLKQIRPKFTTHKFAADVAQLVLPRMSSKRNREQGSSQQS